MVATLSCINIYAQSSQDVNQAVQSAQRLQQIEQQQIQQHLHEQRKSAAPPTQLQHPPEARKTSVESTCRHIGEIHATGVSLLSRAVFNDLVSKYVDRCLGVSDIEDLLGEITRRYIEKGWVSVRAYLPQQDLSHGRLEILVVEGKVSEVQVQDDGKHSISLGNVAPFIQGRSLNLRDLEQALDQINRLASNNATVDMLPGLEPGDSVVVLRNQASLPLHANIAVDNQGSESTGLHQVNVGLSIDNPLGFNDFLSYSKRHTAPLNDLERLSTSDSLSYFIPFGYSTLSLSGSQSRYASTFAAASGNILHNSGISRNYSVRLDHVLHRNASSRWNTYANLGTKASESYLEDVLLSAASRRISALDIGISLNTIFLNGAFSVDLGISQGLKHFAALKDSPDLLPSDPRAQFRKWMISGNYYRPFKLGEQSFDFSSQWTGQYAQDVLYGSEQMLIGSIYTVRGFSNTSLSGDHGFNIRNEIGVRHPFALAGISGSVRSWVGFDYGMVRSRNEGVPEGALTGLALGTQIRTSQRLSLEIFATKPLSKPAEMKFEPTRIWFRIGLAI